jgi:hypothetical protein
MGMKQGLNPDRDHEQGVGNGKARSWNVKVEVKGKGWDDVHRVSLLQVVALCSVRYLAHVAESVYRGLMEMLERWLCWIRPERAMDFEISLTSWIIFCWCNPILSYPACPAEFLYGRWCVVDYVLVYNVVWCGRSELEDRHEFRHTDPVTWYQYTSNNLQ